MVGNALHLCHLYVLARLPDEDPVGRTADQQRNRHDITLAELAGLALAFIISLTG
jgi:hypothetical protein